MQFIEMSAKTGENVEFLNDFVYEVVKERVKLISMMEIYMTMLLWLNEDFDDDLLQDAINQLAQ